MVITGAMFRNLAIPNWGATYTHGTRLVDPTGFGTLKI